MCPHILIAFHRLASPNLTVSGVWPSWRSGSGITLPFPARVTTKEEVDYVIKRVTDVVSRLRELSPLYEMAKEGVDLSKMNWKPA